MLTSTVQSNGRSTWMYALRLTISCFILCNAAAPSKALGCFAPQIHWRIIITPFILCNDSVVEWSVFVDFRMQLTLDTAKVRRFRSWGRDRTDTENPKDTQGYLLLGCDRDVKGLFYWRQYYCEPCDSARSLSRKA